MYVMNDANSFLETKDAPYCPHCNHKQEKHEPDAETLLIPHKVICAHCGKTFLYVVTVTREYTSIKSE